MTSGFRAILNRLDAHNVRYIIVGGAALVMQGSAYITEDLDIVYARDDDNLAALAAALKELNAHLRGSGTNEVLNFRIDSRSLKNGGNFTFTTDEGDLDCLATIDGLGGYVSVRGTSELMALFPDRQTRVLSIDGLIAAKKAANRPKDRQVLPELEAMQELRAADKSAQPSPSSDEAKRKRRSR